MDYPATGVLLSDTCILPLKEYTLKCKLERSCLPKSICKRALPALNDGFSKLSTVSSDRSFKLWSEKVSRQAMLLMIKKGRRRFIANCLFADSNW